MNELELILFRVGHGLSVALIEKPNNYTILVDLGADSNFTPLKYLSLKRRLKPDILYITHPHADHLEDVITALNPHFAPLSIDAQRDYDWNDVASREKPECRELIRAYQRLLAKIPEGSYRGEGSLKYWRYSPQQARAHFGDQCYVNASSLFLIYEWRDFKIAIAGDHESSVMDEFVKANDFVKRAKAADIFVAPHHGHTNGYCSKWPLIVGQPYLTLISVQDRDPHVDGRYSNGGFAKGVKLNGTERKTLTTRTDGNIFGRMYYDNGSAMWSFTGRMSV